MGADDTEKSFHALIVYLLLRDRVPARDGAVKRNLRK